MRPGRMRRARMEEGGTSILILIARLPQSCRTRAEASVGGRLRYVGFRGQTAASLRGIIELTTGKFFRRQRWRRVPFTTATSAGAATAASRAATARARWAPATAPTA